VRGDSQPNPKQLAVAEPDGIDLALSRQLAVAQPNGIHVTVAGYQPQPCYGVRDTESHCN